MAEKTYLVKYEDGTEERITVPGEWKVTFGPTVVGKSDYSSAAGRGGKMPMALRFYESKDNQRAVFTNVVSFRDMSIKIQTKQVKMQEKDGYMECDGVRKRTTFQAKTTEWVDPDEEPKPLPQLPSDKQMFEADEED